MKLFTKIIGAVVGVTILGIIGAVIFISTLDLNKYKPQIIEAFNGQTGRTIAIDGPIDLTLYPVLGVALENVTITQPENISVSEPFATLSSTKVGVKSVSYTHLRAHET